MTLFYGVLSTESSCFYIKSIKTSTLQTLVPQPSQPNKFLDTPA